MVAGMSGPLNAIKRTVIDGKSVILLDGPPQVSTLPVLCPQSYDCHYQNEIP